MEAIAYNTNVFFKQEAQSAQHKAKTARRHKNAETAYNIQHHSKHKKNKKPS
jgi:hypothetical protein